MSLAAQQRYKLELQLFTVRAPLAADLGGTLRRIAELGWHQEVETYGFDPASVGYYKMPAREFAEPPRPPRSPPARAVTTI